MNIQIAQAMCEQFPMLDPTKAVALAQVAMKVIGTEYERVVAFPDESTLVVKVTDEGLIIDLYDAEGNEPATWARTFGEIAESGMLE